MPTNFDWEATPEGVAALLPARTKGTYGEDGEFTADTVPTLAQVELICEKATERIASKLRIAEGKDICDKGPTELAEEVANLRAAMRVELTYFANQIRTDASPYQELKKEYEEGWEDLKEEFNDICGGSAGEDGDTTVGEADPRGNFPRSGNWGRRRF